MPTCLGGTGLFWFLAMCLLICRRSGVLVGVRGDVELIGTMDPMVDE